MRIRWIGILGTLLSILCTVLSLSSIQTDPPPAAAQRTSSLPLKPVAPRGYPRLLFPGLVQDREPLSEDNLFRDLFSMIRRSQHRQALSVLARHGVGKDEALFHKVMCASDYAKGDYGEALRHCLEAAMKNPKDADLLYHAGLLRAQFRLQGTEKVSPFFTNALRIDPDHVPSALALAGLYEGASESSDRIEEGIREKFGQYGYTESDMDHLVGRAMASNGKHGEAVRVLERSIASDQNQATVRIELGREWEALGELGVATAHYAEALENEETRSAALMHLGRIHYSQGRADLALRDYETALREYPEEPGFRPRMASVLDSLGGQAPLVLDLLEEEVSLFPYLARPKLRLAERWIRAGETDRAITHLVPLTRSLDAGSPFPPSRDLGTIWGYSHQLLARLYRSRGEVAKAQALERELADPVSVRKKK